MINRLGLSLLLCLAVVPAFGYKYKAAADSPAVDKHKHGSESGDSKPKSGSAEKNVYDYSLAGADGKDVPMASFKGKMVLLVNLARNSSYNDQLPALIKLSEKYKDQGLVVIGVPSNDFGAAEPGTDPEIQKVYKTDGKVTFLVTERALLTGDQALPLYVFLTKEKGPAGGDVHWNYTKFLIDRNGKVLLRFDPDVAPDSPEMLSTLDQVFAGTYKPKGSEHGKSMDSGGEDDDDD
jgi:glutathione peroxidase